MNSKCVYLVITMWISTSTLSSCSVLPFYPIPEDHECSDNKDCEKDHCCVAVDAFFFPLPTTVTWKCMPLGEEGNRCNSLSSQFCPCKPGYHCRAIGVWFFGIGKCVPVSP
ncbi:uncharacterized protein LOC143234148 [Tachypleus tridentatus]|uniref:uncharacterized protein LOC143234148 n=1 Tax=Tachypleus tridentatus TaxID=6853 RepID=UPI003FD43DBD